MHLSIGTALLRVLDVILNVARFFLFLATILFGLLAVVGLFGSNTVQLDGTTDAVALRYTDDVGQVITAEGSGSTIEQPGEPDPTQARTTVIPDFGRTAVTVELEERAPKFAAIGFITPRVMDALLDPATLPIDGFRTASQVSDPWLWLIVGLLFVAVGQAFDRGVELEALAEATI